MQAVGNDYLVCNAARNGAACNNTRSVRRGPIEEGVLEGLKNRLMARFHPGLADRYRELVSQLQVALNKVDARAEAAEILRPLVEDIEVGTADGQTTITLTADIVKLMALPGAKVPASFESSVKVVAGTGFEPVTFRL
jgi:hypothetical protein